MISMILAVLMFASNDKLIISDMKPGKGDAAKKGEIVTVTYRGSLTNGKEFDSSEGRPPFVFELGAGRVIKGWDQGLVGMKVGGVRKLVIPPSLGYGDAGAPPEIPGGATLTFEVEMLRIEPAGGGRKVEIKTIKEGTGKGAVNGDSLEVHYKGTFLNGKTFDSSYDRNTPLSVKLGAGGVIPGFEQGLLGIKLGEKRKVVIPFALAYGENGRSSIPPMSTLVFELERMK